MTGATTTSGTTTSGSTRTVLPAPGAHSAEVDGAGVEGLCDGEAAVGVTDGAAVVCTEPCELGSPESEQAAREPASTIAGKHQLTNRDHFRIAQVWHGRGASAK